MTEAGELTREQELLKKLRDDYCGGNSAELARRLKTDPTYVNRLFYPVGKKGRKGIGLTLMRSATQAFDLPPGFWEGADGPEQGELLPAPQRKEQHADAAEATGRAVEAAVNMLADMLQPLDAGGREMAALMLKNLAMNPQGERGRVINMLLALHTPPEPPEPARKGAKAKPGVKSKAATRTNGNASLVLKLGGGQRQMFHVPMQPLHKAIDNRNASQAERDWYATVKAAPKATP